MNMKQTLRCLLTFPIEESILLCGNHGIGKSQIVKQAAAKLGIPCIDFRLSQNDVGDLKGMPFHVNGRTVFAPPEFFPLKEADAIELKEFLGLTNDISKGRFGDKGILFLDEINRANREVQQAAFELVLDRRLNLRALPDGWRVVSAINSEDDIYSVNSLDPAFLSRFFKIDLEPTVEEWLTWAESSGVHPVIVEFIRKNDTLLDPTKEQLIEASTKGVVKLHDRRAYHKFSNTIHKMVADYEAGLESKDPLAKDTAQVNWMFMVASGYLGTIASAQFKNFLETDYQALDANAILNKWSEEVEARLKNVVEIGRIPELSGYNEGLLAYIRKNIKDKLNTTQAKNLARYFTLMPNELRGDLWQKFHKENKPVAEAWYREASLDGRPNKTIVLSALVNPDAAKKNAALAGK
jgi:hypothetical protein